MIEFLRIPLSKGHRQVALHLRYDFEAAYCCVSSIKVKLALKRASRESTSCKSPLAEPAHCDLSFHSSLPREARSAEHNAAKRSLRAGHFNIEPLYPAGKYKSAVCRSRCTGKPVARAAST